MNRCVGLASSRPAGNQGREGRRRQLQEQACPGFLRRFGEDAASCEIDALHPDDLRRLVDVSIAKVLTGEDDDDEAKLAAMFLLDEKKADEAAEIVKLQKMVKRK